MGVRRHKNAVTREMRVTTAERVMHHAERVFEKLRGNILDKVWLAEGVEPLTVALRHVSVNGVR